MLTHKTSISSSTLGYFIYNGTYETILGEYLGGVKPDDYAKAEEEVANLYLEILTDAFCDMFSSAYPDAAWIDEEFSFTYDHTYHPAFYNFETDNIVFDFEYSDKMHDWIFDYVKNSEFFDKYLHDNFTSGDGFISCYANNWNDWLVGWNANNCICIASALRFIIEQEFDQRDMENYRYNFDEGTVEIIEQNYCPWEYAAKFKNGYVGYVWIHSYDEYGDGAVYGACLIDNNGNIINTAQVFDRYDDDFHNSAYAAWQYIVSDLTDRYKLCGWSNEPCDIPQIPMEKLAECVKL